jgi:hypothetical protein
MPCAVKAAGTVPTALNSEHVTLPDSNSMFPPGPGADAINNNCLACHSTDMVLYQPSLSKDAWAKIVHKMIINYKAPVAPADIDAIVEYLSRTKGVK